MSAENKKNKPVGGGSRYLLRAAVLAASLALAGCAALQEATQSPEEAAANEPTRVPTAGAEEEFPSLAEVPNEPRPRTAPEDRERVMEELAQDRAEATFTEAEPLETAAPPDPFSTTLVVDGESATTTEGFNGPPLKTQAGQGQLAAIIFFGHGSAELDARDRSVLHDVATLQQQRGGNLRVVGHASSRTHNATPEEHRLANLEMSLNRANVVLDELLRLGVPETAAQAEAVGDAEPVYHEFMPSGEAGNRRVEIFLEN